MSVVDELERLFPGRGAVAANVLRNQGIWVETHDLEASAPPERVEPAPDAENAAPEGGDAPDA